MIAGDCFGAPDQERVGLSTSQCSPWYNNLVHQCFTLIQRAIGLIPRVMLLGVGLALIFSTIGGSHVVMGGSIVRAANEHKTHKVGVTTSVTSHFGLTCLTMYPAVRPDGIPGLKKRIKRRLFRRKPLFLMSSAGTGEIRELRPTCLAYSLAKLFRPPAYQMCACYIS